MTVTTEVWTLIAVLAAVMLALLAVVGGALFGLAPRIDNLGAMLRGELHGVRDELRGELHGVRDELRGVRDELRGVRDELRGELHGVRDEFRGELHEMRTELRGEIAGQTARLDTINLRLDEQVKETAGLRVEVGQILQRLARVESAA